MSTFVLILLSVASVSGAAHTIHGDHGVDGVSAGDSTDMVDDLSSDVGNPEAIDSNLRNSSGTTEVLVHLKSAGIDVSSDRATTLNRLRVHAERSQRPVVSFASRHNNAVRIQKQLWLTNAILLTVDTDEVSLGQLAQVNGVESIAKNSMIHVPKNATTSPSKARFADSGDTSDIDDEAEIEDYNTTYGLDQINATEVWNGYNAQGQGVKVAVLDSGVDISHPALDLYTDDASNGTYPGGWAEFNPDGEQVLGSTPTAVCGAHGTHTSGTISGNDSNGQWIGVAPNVQLMHGAVLTESSLYGCGGSNAEIIAGMQWAVTHDADVISMSLGGDPDGSFVEAVRNAQAAGTVVVASIGNDGAGTSGSPGNIYESISVGATNEERGIADYSGGEIIGKDETFPNPPSEWPSTYVVPDIAAPGTAVVSSIPSGEYGPLSGTSMAAPHVAGTVGLMLSAGGEDLTVSEIKSALYETAEKPAQCAPSCDPRDGNDTRYGAGIIDAERAVSVVAGIGSASLLGDVDESGKLTVEDIRAMQQYLYGSAPETFNEDLADLNRDGEVTSRDLQLLQRRVQGSLNEPSVEISNLSTPESVNDTETVAVTADLKNTGDVGALQTIELYADTNSSSGGSTPIDTVSVDMAPGGVENPVDSSSQTTVEFEIPAAELGDPGNHTITVSSDDDVETTSISVLASDFRVSNLSGPDEVDEGDDFTVSATVTNAGNKVDTQLVEYRFDETTEATLNITLAPDESTEVTFDGDTAGVAAGTHQYGVYTDDDDATADFTVNEGFFEPTITDAPAEVAPGETFNVSATIENTGNATDGQRVEYRLNEAETDVAVVGTGTEYSNQTATALRDRLPDRYDITVVNDTEVMDQVDAYDTFVIQDITPSDVDIGEFVAATDGPETGVVWLDAWGTDSDSIEALSTVTGDPEVTSDSYDGNSPVSYKITGETPLFVGVGDPGDTIPIHNASYPDRIWFSGYSGETLATVSAQGSDEGGSAISVDEDSSTVLAATLARESFVTNDEFTEAADTILANAVAYAASNEPVGTSPNALAPRNTSENISLDPGDSTEVELTYTVSETIDTGTDHLHLVTTEDDEAQQPVDIEVATGDITGVVMDESGTPIEGAAVSVNGTDEDDRTMVTDEEGRFRFEGVTAGIHDVTAAMDGHSNVTKTVDVPANDTTTVDFTLSAENGSISGTITSIETGDPVANVSVMAEDNDDHTYSATTGENGTYTIEVPAGTYSVNVGGTPDGYSAQSIVSVDADEAVTGVDFQVSHTNPDTGSIKGTVTNGAGTPIEGAAVVDADAGTFNVSTDDKGYYELSNLTAETYALRAKIPSDESSLSFVEVTPGQTAMANFTLGSYFEVSDLSAPSTADQGETINVSATVTNTGTEDATQSVFYLPPGTRFTDAEAMDSPLFREVSLDGGESETVSFTYTVAPNRTPSDYRHGISADNVVDSTLTVKSNEPDPAYFALSNVSGPSEASPDEEFSANVTVTNTGDEQATQMLYPFLESDVETDAYDLAGVGSEQLLRLFHPNTAPQQVTLDGGESQEVSFTYTVPDDASGDYAYTISSLQDISTHSLVVSTSNMSRTAMVDGAITSKRNNTRIGAVVS